MQSFFLDIPVETWNRSSLLQEWITRGYAEIQTLRACGYDRIRLLIEDVALFYELMETIILQEGLYIIWKKEGLKYRSILGEDHYLLLQKQVTDRIKELKSQLQQIIHSDLKQHLLDTNHLNIAGYLQFSAHRLNGMLQDILQEEYRKLEQELEEKEFIELLRFFVAIQQPSIEKAYLTIRGTTFTLTDEWGHDLYQIYLESFLNEEIEEIKDISDNDLLVSILISLLPRVLYISVKELPPSNEFLGFLQQIFGDQMVWL